MIQNLHPTKLAIMKAAVDVFIKKGFSGATTKEIAQSAGISEGAVFRHFPNKAEILYGIVEGFLPLMGVDTLKQTCLECKDLNARDAVRYIIENRLEIIRESAALVRLILIESIYDTKLQEIYREQVYRPIHNLIYHFFEERIKKGDFIDINPNLPTDIIISFILYDIFGRELVNSEIGNFSADSLTDILLEGIQKRGGNDA